MSELEVRIVTLEPMRAACAHGFGKEPENQAWQKIQAFAQAQGIDLNEVHTYGFNNPDPSPGSPNYGYDIWLPVGPDVEGEGDVEIKRFEGGLYAVTRFKDLNNIGRVWKELVTWREDSPYKKACHQCLEHLLTSPDVPIEEFVFDLYLPIAK